ncbi:hypothetical protein Q1695_015946 [Nippostrongylus brasiliensis]|nr:hypothetical protein Q1695_015946 [Nippostrongylus brasiliensis]
MEGFRREPHFNERFSSARRIVESVFEILSARFRIFQRALIGSPHNCKLLIAATLVLHNLLAQRLTPQQLLARYRPRISVSARRQNSRSQPSHDAQEQRMRMVRYFARDDL